MKYLLVVLSFLLITNLYAKLDEEKIQGTNKLSEIVIKENRLEIPFMEQNRNVTVLDQDIIKNLPVKSINELLTYVAGVDVRQRGPWGAQADIGMDGGTFDQTLVLLNGIKISDPQTGHNMMNIPVSLETIERIEILKGPAARIYGINALNGAINIITTQPQGNFALLHVFGGTSFEKDTSNNKMFGGAGIEASLGLVHDNIHHLLSLNHHRSSGYRYNTASENNKVFYQNQINLKNEGSINLLAGFVHNDFGANGFYAAPGDKESKEKLQTVITGLSAKLPINSFWTLRPRISYRYNNDDYIFIRQNPDFYRNLHETNVINAELNNTFKTSLGNFGLGLEWRNEFINSSNLGKWNRENYGFFGEYNFDIIDDFILNIGSYVNYNSEFGWQLLPGIDMGYQLKNNIRIFANAGTGQRLPTYTDLYYVGPSNIGNDQLRPEKSVQGEVGIKYHNSKWTTSASYFYRKNTDFIDWVKDAVMDPWQPYNFSEIRTKGISLNIDYRWSNDEQLGDFDILSGLSYNWLQPEIITNEQEFQLSQYALEHLKNQFVARLNITYLKKFNMSISSKYQQRVSQTAYTLFDARFTVLLDKLEVYTDLNNLSNVSYIEAGAIPMPGRWVTLGLKFKL